MGQSGELHVLVVASRYPAWDDQGEAAIESAIRAIAAAGHRVSVASCESIGTGRSGEGSGDRRAEPATEYPDPAGAAAAFERLTLANELLDDALASPAALARPVSWGAGTPVARLPILHDGRRRPFAEAVEAHAGALLPFGLALHRRDPIHVVHAFGGLPDGVAAGRLAAELPAPLLTVERHRSIGDELIQANVAALYRELLGVRRRVVAVGRSLADEIAERIGAPPQTVGVLPDPVVIDDLVAVGPDGRDPNELLHLGPRRSARGIETLIRAFALARAGRRSLRLRLVGPPGDDADEARWRALVEELRLAKAVTFEDGPDRDGRRTLLARAALLVDASQVEPFAPTVVEALASGLPVVATPSGIETIVAARSLGETARTHSPEALAAAIVAALARRDGFDATAMRERAAAYAPAAVAAATGELYRALLVASAPRRRRLVAVADQPPASGEAERDQGPGRADPGGRVGGRGGGRTDADASPGRPDPWIPPLVVALEGAAVRGRLASLPAELAERLTLVTADPAFTNATGFGTVVVVDPERDFLAALEAVGGQPPTNVVSRLRQAVGDPLRERRRIRLMGRRDEILRDALADGIRVAWEAANRPGWIVALEPDDIAALEPIVASASLEEDGEADADPTEAGRPRLAPGSLRWLVDTWDAAGR